MDSPLDRFLSDLHKFINHVISNAGHPRPAPVKQSITLTSITYADRIGLSINKPTCIFCGLPVSDSNFVAITQVLFDGTSKTPGKILYHHNTCKKP